MASLGRLNGRSRVARWPVSVGSMVSLGRLDGRSRVARWPVSVGSMVCLSWLDGQFQWALWPVSVGSMVCLSWLDGQFQWALWPVLRGSVAVHRTHRSAPVFGSVASVSERIAQRRFWLGGQCLRTHRSAPVILHRSFSWCFASFPPPSLTCTIRISSTYRSKRAPSLI
jgi:hypothetical protein